MGSPERPPVTIVVPGATGADPDVVSNGRPSSERRRPRPRWARAAAVVMAAAGLIAAAGLLTTSQLIEQPAEKRVSSAQGITATVGLVGRPLSRDPSVRLIVVVELDGAAPSGPLRLLGISGRGFWVQPVDVELPLLVEPDARSTAFDIEVLVNDCGVEPSAPRRLDLAVERSDHPPSSLSARSDPDVVRALDRLVARTCGRPRG